jgi:predicted transcriptional regulator
MSQLLPETDFLHLTAGIVAAYASNHEMDARELPNIIRQVHAALSGVKSDDPAVQISHKDPAVPVNRSVFRDYIICLEDGRKMKLLKGHLMSSYKLTPEEYRAKWGLPPDYPMVAPSYSERRSELALKIGLGRT